MRYSPTQPGKKIQIVVKNSIKALNGEAQQTNPAEEQPGSGGSGALSAISSRMIFRALFTHKKPFRETRLPPCLSPPFFCPMTEGGRGVVPCPGRELWGREVTGWGQRGDTGGGRRPRPPLHSLYGPAPGSLLLPPHISPLPRHPLALNSPLHVLPLAAHPHPLRPVPVGGAMPGVPGAAGGPALLTRPGRDRAGPTHGACAPTTEQGRESGRAEGFWEHGGLGPLSPFPSFHPGREQRPVRPHTRSPIPAPALGLGGSGPAPRDRDGERSPAGSSTQARPFPWQRPLSMVEIRAGRQRRFRPPAPPPRGGNCACALVTAPPYKGGVGGAWWPRRRGPCAGAVGGAVRRRGGRGACAVLSPPRPRRVSGRPVSGAGRWGREPGLGLYSPPGAARLGAWCG